MSTQDLAVTGGHKARDAQLRQKKKTNQRVKVTVKE